jgi:6,7-dimethyl-8-ribityllumazine synthase
MSRDLESRRRSVPPLPAGARLAAVVSTYHHELTERMLRSAAAVLEEAGLGAGQLLEVRVPGCFELPLVARRCLARDDVDAVLCFGLVLKGETEHDRHIAAAVSQALMGLSLQLAKPCLFGVLTCATLAQAERRALPLAQGGLDKGREVALAAIGALGALQQAAQAFGLEQGRSER